MSPVNSAPAQHVPVVIVGGGPTGITAATLLAQYGVQSLVLDRWAQVYPQPRAVHLDDEVFRILARLGVAAEFAEISRPARGLRLIDRNMAVLAQFDRDTALTRNGFPAASMFDQPELEKLLRANLSRYPNASFRGDTEVIEVLNEVHRLGVRVRDRGNDTESVITADYLLGCDGANSMVRAAIGADMRSFKFDQRWLVIDIATDADLHQWEGVHQLCDDHRAGTYMRIGPTRYRWEFRLLDHETVDDYATLAELRPLIAPWTRDVDDADLRLIRVAEYTFRAQLADRWRQDNIFLLGDAAHLTPPFIGQGMGAGLRDAMNLAWKIAGVWHGDLPHSALDSYQRERRPHARHMIALALNMGRAMTSGGRFGTAARSLIVPKLHLVPGLRAKVTDSQTPPLRSSTLVKRSAVTHGITGHLCPNALLDNGSRLDDELVLRFGFITTVELTPAQRGLVEARGAVAVHAAPGSELARWLTRHHVNAVTVRPDRTVSNAGKDIAAVVRTLPPFQLNRHRSVLPNPGAHSGNPAGPLRALATLTMNRNHDVFRQPANVPVYRPDIYSRSAILDPYPHYRAMRELGPVVWLPRHRLYALPRFAECKATLRDDGLFISGQGVAANPLVNRLSRGTTLNSDGADHDRRRKLVAHRLMPRALRTLSDDVEACAGKIVDDAVSRQNVDAVTDLATALPLAIVPDLVGWPRDQRDHLLDWAAATFDILGPLNLQALKALPSSMHMLRFARHVVRERNVLPGSMAHELLTAVDAGDLSADEVPPLLIDYIAPSLDTTISAISSALYLFATHPDQWQLLKEDPSLIPNAINEVVRYESPLRAFTRKTAQASVIADAALPAGARVLVLYASANRDEREWDAPDVFDIRNDAGRHVGFGSGTHACAGQGLARLETTAMLKALIERVDRIEVSAEPTWGINNIIHRHARLPVRLIPA